MSASYALQVKAVLSVAGTSRPVSHERAFANMTESI
jgi:hypothetical protein